MLEALGPYAKCMPPEFSPRFMALFSPIFINDLRYAKAKLDEVSRDILKCRQHSARVFITGGFIDIFFHAMSLFYYR